MASLCRLLGSSPHCRRGGRYPQLVGVGVGKRRWYATIFSFDRPRSRSISTERRGRSLSRAGFTPRSSSPWPLSCRPLVFTRADSFVFILAVPPQLFHVSALQCMTTRIAFMVYLSSLTGMRRLAIAPSEWLGGPSRPPPPPSGRRHLWQAALTRPRRDRSGAAASLPPLFQQQGQQRQPPPQAPSAQPPRPRPTAYWP